MWTERYAKPSLRLLDPRAGGAGDEPGNRRMTGLMQGRRGLVMGLAGRVIQGVRLKERPELGQLRHAGGVQGVPKRPGAAVGHGRFVGVHFNHGVVDAQAAERRQHVFDGVHPGFGGLFPVEARGGAAQCWLNR